MTRDDDSPASDGGAATTTDGAATGTADGTVTTTDETPAATTDETPAATTDSVVGRLQALASGVRFAEFASVGAVGAVLDTTVLLVLTGPFGVSTWLAKLVAAESAILLMFAVNERWTFAGEGDPALWPRRLAKSNVVRVGGVLVATGVVTALDRYVEVAIPLMGFDLWLIVANGAGIATGLAVNYVAESLFTWRVHE